MTAQEELARALQAERADAAIEQRGAPAARIIMGSLIGWAAPNRLKRALREAARTGAREVLADLSGASAL